MMTLQRLQRALVVLALVATGLAVSAENAFATHFRYGTITWTTPNPAQPNVIQVRFDAAWRRSYPWTPANPLVGQVVQPGSLEVLNAAGTTLLTAVTINATVTTVNVAEDWFGTSWTSANITLPATVPADYILRFTGCCRISTLADNNHDQTYTVLSRVTVRSPVNRPPVSASLPVIGVAHNTAAATFVVPAFDPDGDTLTYAFSPLAESGLVIISPPGMSINPSTGVVTWNTVGTTIGALYEVQFKVTDSKGASTVVDVIVTPVSGVGAPPTVRINGVAAAATFTIVQGTPLNFAVTTSSLNATPVTLTSSSLPVGAAMAPSLPTQSLNGNVSSNFSWTPAPSQIGSYIISYSAVNGTGQQGLQSVNINVTNNQPTLSCTPPGTIETIGPGFTPFSIGATFDDVDHDLLIAQIFIDGVPKAISGSLPPPNLFSYSGSALLGSHTYEVRVTDSIGTPVSCTGTFAIVDTTAPALSLPPDAILTATSPAGAVHTFTATATDIGDTFVNVACVPPSGSVFPIGLTTVTCSANDHVPNITTGTFTVTVNPAPTALSAVLAGGGSTALVGGSLTAIATLSRTSAPVGPLGGNLVVFTLTGPSPSTATTEMTGTSDSFGLASVAFPLAARGVYTVSAQFAGTPALQPSASSASATVTVYQRTALTMAPSPGTAGTPLAVSATLMAVPQNTPLAGQSIAFYFDANPTLDAASATTAGNGVATVTATFPVAGTFTTSASFANYADYFLDGTGNVAQTFVNTSVTVVRAATSLSPVVSPVSALVGGDLTVAATLSRISAPAGLVDGALVTFTVTGPSPSTATMQFSANTHGGLALGTFTPVARGVYTVSAESFGDGALLPSSVGPTPVTVYQRTMLFVNVVHGTAGETLSESANLVMLPAGGSLTGETVTFSFTGNATPETATAVTDATGLASTSTTFPIAGTFSINAAFSNAAAFYTDAAGTLPPVPTVVNAPITIQPGMTSLALQLSPSPVLVGGDQQVSAQLIRTSAPAGPVAGRAVVFTLSGPASTVVTATTDANGFVNLNFPINVRGQYTLSAQFAGDQVLQAATSATYTWSVYQLAKLTIPQVSGTAGDAVTLSATLVALPDDTPIVGQTVVLWGDGAPSQALVTDANGQVSGFFTFATGGSFGSHAMFDGFPDFYLREDGSSLPTTAAGTVTIATAVTSLSALTLPTTVFVEDILPVATVLSRVSPPAGVLAGGLLTLTVAGPGGPQVQYPTTDAGGAVSANFQLNFRGQHTVTAEFYGDGALQSTSTSGSVNVYQKTRLAWITPASIPAGTPVTLMAVLTAIPLLQPIGSQSVTIDFGGVLPTQTVTTDVNGAAQVTVTFPVAGSYPVTASFLNVADYLANRTGAFAAEVATVTAVIVDSTPPVITPTVTGTQVNGWYTSNVQVSWTVSDGESPVTTQTGCDASTISADGSVTLACTATSTGGTGSTSVTVARDSTAPSLTTSPNLSVVATSATGATVNYAAATATDATSGVAAISCVPAAGFFPLGATTVNCTATDNAGNTSTGSFTVTVTDPTPPVITPTVAGTLGANGWYTSDVTVSWMVTDPDSGITSSTGCTTSTTNTDGASFTKTCTATSAGGTSTQSVTFKRDASAPTITVSPNKTDDADSWDGTDVTYAAATSADPTSGIASVVCAPPSGSTFPIGVTMVSCVATNNAGLTKTGTFTVTIVDRGEPGRMFGRGETPGPSNHKIEFDFSVFENRRGNEWGDVEIKVRDTRRRRGDDERFDARTVDDVFFSNAPDYGPGHNSKTGIDTVIFRGTGKWDGRSGYTYVVTASDRGEPGRGRDTFSIEIKSPTGAVVFTGGGTLSDGNVQSSRLNRSWNWWNGHHDNHWDNRGRGRDR